MKLIKQTCEWVSKPVAPLELIEAAGRTCYKSEDKITPGSARRFTEMVIKRGHESVIEHANASMRFITNRGVTHELVRHRLCAFSQESTRYVRYDGNMEFILPVWLAHDLIGTWTFKTFTDRMNALHVAPSDPEYLFIDSCIEAELCYGKLLTSDWRPEQAREVLPNALKTEIVVTANLREWRHILKLRTSKAAHPQIRDLMIGALNMFKREAPILFDDIQS